MKKRKPFAVVFKASGCNSYKIRLGDVLTLNQEWVRDVAYSWCDCINSALAVYLDDIGREAIGRVSNDAKRRGRKK